MLQNKCDAGGSDQVFALLRLLRDECESLTGPGTGELTLRAMALEKALEGSSTAEKQSCAEAVRSWLSSSDAMPDLDASKRTTLLGIVSSIKENAIGDAAC